MKRIIVVGAGGFAREVKWLIEELARTGAELEFRGFVVSDLSRLSEHDSRAEVLGDLQWLAKHRDEFDGLALGIGTPAARLRVAEELEVSFGPELWPVLIHPTVQFDRKTLQVAHGALLCAGVIGTVNLEVGAFALVNLACTLGHEAKLGKACVLNPTVSISGGAEIGAGALVGTGAQVLQYVKVGVGATVGAGAVVNRDVAPGTTVVGVPAKVLVNRSQ